RLLKAFEIAFRLSYLEPIKVREHFFDLWRHLQSLQLGVAQRLNIVVEAVDRHPSLGISHCREQMAELLRRVRCKIGKMPGMKDDICTIDSDVNKDRPAHAEPDRWRARIIGGTVADKECI